MLLKYETIYSRFLQKVDDVEFLDLDKDTAYAKMSGWLRSAASGAYVRNLFSNITFNDDIMTITYDMKRPSDTEDEDADFLAELFSLGMMVEWLTPKVETTTLIMRGMFGREQKYYSEANHLNQLRGMLEDAELRFNKMITARGFIKNAYVAGEL